MLENKEFRLLTVAPGLGNRLKEERERLEMSQTVLGNHGGVGRLTQIAYETEKTAPRVTYLFQIRKFGVDISYVVFGIPESSLHQNVSDAIEARAFDLVEACANATSSGQLGAEARLQLFYLFRKILNQVESGHLPRNFDPLSLILR